MKEYLDFTVEPDGTMPTDKSLRVKQILKERVGKWLRMMITNERQRTIPQNSYFHKIVQMITDFERALAKEAGDELYYKITFERKKLEIKEDFLGWVEVNGKLELMHSSKLTTIQMNELWENLQIHYAPLGLDIPNPNEKDYRIGDNKN